MTSAIVINDGYYPDVPDFSLKYPVIGNLNFYGPFEVGTSLYCFVYDNNRPLASTTFAIWAAVSTDGGTSWTLLDTTNAPVADGVSEGGFNAVLVGTTLYVAYYLQGVQVQIRPFSTTSNTWGADIVVPNTAQTDGPLGSNRHKIIRSFSMISLSDGSLSFLYTFTDNLTPGITTYSTFWEKYASGSWSIEFTVFAPDQVTYPAAPTFRDSSDNTYVVIYDDNLTQTALSMATVSATGTVSATAPVTSTQFGLGQGIIHASTIVIPTVDVGALGEIHLLLGTPVNAPVWSEISINASDLQQRTPNVWMAENGSDLAVFWAAVDQGTGAAQVMKGFWTGAGVTTQTVFYDIDANPPANVTPDNSFLASLSAAFLSSTSDYAIMLGAQVDVPISNPNFNPGSTAFAAFFFAPGSTPPPPTPVTAIISGGAGDNYHRSQSQTHWSIGMKPPRPQDCCVPEKYTPSGAAFYKPQQRAPEPCCIPGWYRNIKRPPRG